MAVTIVATAGSASANSFTTLAAADAYAEGKSPAPTVWDAASDDTCNRALVSATRWLTAQAWLGRQTTDTQALAWPRQDVIDPADPYGNWFDDSTIPQVVKDATAELALLFVAGASDIAALPSTAGIIRKRVDVLETEYAAPYLRAQGLNQYPTVTRILRGLLESTSGANTRVVRG